MIPAPAYHNTHKFFSVPGTRLVPDADHHNLKTREKSIFIKITACQPKKEPMRNRKPVTRKKRILKTIAITVASALVIVAGVVGYMVWDFNNRLADNSVDISEPEPKAPEKIEPTLTVEPYEGAFTMLLVGNDDGNGLTEKYGERDHTLNDVNILLHVSEDHTTASAISVPRDTFVNIPECTDPETGVTTPAGTAKINQALTRGGLKCVADTFRELTGHPVDYAAMIQFEGVVALSNAVGGVPVCLTSDINDPHSGLNLTAGEHTLQGDAALAFLRTRYGVGDGSDLARISNQQVFLSSLMRTLKSKETLTDVKKVYEIANVVADNMTLSSNMASISTLASLAYAMKDIPLENIAFLQYPTTLVEDGLVPKTEPAQVMLDAVFSGQPVEITGGTAPGNIGAVENTPAPENTTSPTPTGTPTTSPTPEPTETPVALPEDVTGQKATQNTCSRGYGDY